MMTPPFFVGRSPEEAQPLTDRDTVIETGVLDPVVLARHLDVTVTDARVGRVLKHHPGKRCTLEVAVRAGDRWHSLIAKVYRKDRSDVFDVMRAIQGCGFGPADEFSISQPVGYLPSLRCLLQGQVEGTPADEVFRNGDERARADAAERSARWLASFHARAPKIGPISHPKAFVCSKSMRRWSRKIARLNGPFGLKATYLFHRLEDASALLGDVELLAGHGSYTAAHVYLSQEQTVAIDWDWHDVADPARDVARFLYALRRWALDQLGSIRALDGPVNVFLRTYRAAGIPDMDTNLHFYAAATCLNLAVRHLFDADASWQEKQEKAEAMLDEGLSVLDRGAVQ